jgi:hypothetical protein
MRVYRVTAEVKIRAVVETQANSYEEACDNVIDDLNVKPLSDIVTNYDADKLDIWEQTDVEEVEEGW